MFKQKLVYSISTITCITGKQVMISHTSGGKGKDHQSWGNRKVNEQSIKSE
jgi:hypothetical protein